MAQNIRSKPYDPAEDAAVFLMRLGFIVLFFGIPIGSELSHRSLFLLFPIGLALILGSSLLVVSQNVRLRLSRFEISALSASAVFLVLWSVLSLLWSPSWSEGVDFAIKAILTGFFTALTCHAMPDHTRSSNLYLISLGLFLATFLILFRTVPSLINGSLPPVLDERAGITLAILAWPGVAALAIRRHVAWAGALAILVALTLIITRQVETVAILAFSAIVYSASLANHEKLRSEKLARILGLGFGAFIVLAPLLALVFGLFAGSAASGTFGAIAAAIKQSLLSDSARLVTGRGLGASSHSALAAYSPQGAHWLMFESWFDLGILGVLTLAALIYRVFLASLELNPALSGFVLACLTCILLFAIFGQGLVQIWWLTLLAIVAIAFRAVANGAARTHRPGAMKPV